MDKIKLRVKAHEEFSMPHALDISALVISNQRKGISDSFVDFYKWIIVEAFSKSKKVHEAADYISDKLFIKEGGLWFCSIEQCKSICNYSVCYKNEKTLSFKFERNGNFYLISIIKTCNDGC